MARHARVVAPGLPHHITQRGNRKQRTFFGVDDYLRYLALMAEWCDRCSVDIWAYCLMPNHVHFIGVPETEDGLRKAVGEAHRRYTREVNDREGWRGYLWQGRFASFVMDEPYTLAAARYIELNPVRAGLVARAEQYPWSSARAHLLGRDDGVVKVLPLLTRVGEWNALLGESAPQEMVDEFHKHESTGRPLGSDEFVDRLEGALDRVLRPLKPGPRPS
jgi:putative transposase